MNRTVLLELVLTIQFPIICTFFDVGLCCCIVRNPHSNVTYIVLTDRYCAVEIFIQKMFDSCESQSNGNQLLSTGTIQRIINSMDTEYDKQCVKAILSCEFP